PGLPDPSRGDHDRFGPEDHKPAVLAPVAERAADAAGVREQPRDGALHVHVDAELHSAVLERADHFQAGAVPDVAEALEGVAAEASASIAARRPAPPAPMTGTSCSCVSYFSVTGA